jgi:hypothetical protein
MVQGAEALRGRDALVYEQHILVDRDRRESADSDLRQEAWVRCQAAAAIW